MQWLSDWFFRFRLLGSMLAFGMQLAWGVLLRQKSLLALMAVLCFVGLGASSTYLLASQTAAQQYVPAPTPARHATLASDYNTENIMVLSTEARELWLITSQLLQKWPENYLLMENGLTLTQSLQQTEEYNRLFTRRHTLDSLTSCTFIQQADSRLRITCAR